MPLALFVMLRYTDMHMVTIVALGNIGEEYVRTRHNVGWMVMRDIIEKRNLPHPVSASKYSAEISEGMLEGKEISILFPSTFMNKSGVSLKRYREAKGMEEELIVIHDEVDLPFGSIKISRDRGAGGHNGVKSIIDVCGGKGFTRIRIGISPTGFFGNLKRPKGEKLPKFVLGEFKPSELKKMDEIVEKVDEALSYIVRDGVEKAMQKVNT